MVMVTGPPSVRPPNRPVWVGARAPVPNANVISRSDIALSSTASKRITAARPPALNSTAVALPYPVRATPGPTGSPNNQSLPGVPDTVIGTLTVSPALNARLKAISKSVAPPFSDTDASTADSDTATGTGPPSSSATATDAAASSEFADAARSSSAPTVAVEEASMS